MNWGLFLALSGFLLLLTLAVRVATALALAGLPATHPLQATRIAQLLMLAVPLTAKAPAMLFALTGRWGDLGQMAEAFMLTPWGFAQAALIVAGVGWCDLIAPAVVASLAGTKPARAGTSAYLRRDFAILGMCMLLAWVAQL